jgi:hypothetical protein
VFFTLEEGYPQGIAYGVSPPEQYIGTDAYGTDIYEYDIVETNHNKLYVDETAEKPIRLICYNSNIGGYTILDRSNQIYHSEPLPYGFQHSFKVIGNIHQHEALLPTYVPDRPHEY